ncbi:MAG: hypothetical protein BWZ10_01515 [candidate division BRC1 bacterium ADurb.BinA364]|nr:MAG: hypothetical protein BWZ10_01515 [candidate division BRC1 bacterium ADurb.BinA364]
MQIAARIAFFADRMIDQRADFRNFAFDHVARLDRAGPGRRSGGDHIARLERHDRAHQLDDFGNVQNQVLRVACLPDFAVDTAIDVEMNGRIDRSCRDDAGAHRGERVVGFGAHPGGGGADILLEYVDGGHIVQRRVAENVLHGVALFDAASGAADHDRQFGFEIDRSDIGGKQDFVVRADHARRWLHEDYRPFFRKRIGRRLRRLIAQSQADNFRRTADRRLDSSVGWHAKQAHQAVRFDERTQFEQQFAGILRCGEQRGHRLDARQGVPDAKRFQFERPRQIDQAEMILASQKIPRIAPHLENFHCSPRARIFRRRRSAHSPAGAQPSIF